MSSRRTSSSKSSRGKQAASRRSDHGPTRRLPFATRQQVLLEAGYMCANPRCRHIITLELHHIIWVRDGGGNDAENLLALCPNCHSLHTAGHIPPEAIRVWKGTLLSLNNANRSNADILLIIYRQFTHSLEHVPFSVEGLLAVAGLLNAGLLEVTGGSFGGGGMFSHSAFRLTITERGRLLVEAWLAGDEGKLRRAIQGPNAV